MKKVMLVTASQLVEDDMPQLAPVSGPRCRDCGTTAKYAPPGERWAVIYGAAYCPSCVPPDDAGDKAKEVMGGA